MAANWKTSVVALNAEATASGALCNNGTIQVRTGAQPANPEASATGTLLATLTFGATAFAAASGGVITANAIGSDSSADATGTAGWFRCYKSDGTTAVFDGDCGTSAADMILNTTSIVTGDVVACSAMTYTRPQ